MTVIDRPKSKYGNEDIEALESSQHRNELLRKKYIGLLLLYSVIVYIVTALVFYFKYFPTNWKDRVLRSAPLLVFPLVIYGVKRLLHYLFVSRMTKNARKLEELRDKKKKVLEEVMENETYKTAKELLDKYDPNSDICKDERKEVASPGPLHHPQSPAGTELRHRNVASGIESPVVPLQRATSVPTLSESPSPRGSPGVVPQEMPPGHSSEVPNKANSMSNLGPKDAPAHRILPVPPKPAFPILPRERSNMEKVVEYLIGDGPSNRYALICQQCSSHNGMALKEEFEYVAFRCCYCFHFNPARKKRLTAPKLEDDPLTPGRTRKNPPSSPKKGSTNGPIKHRRPVNRVHDMVAEKKQESRQEEKPKTTSEAIMNGDDASRGFDESKETKEVEEGTESMACPMVLEVET